METCGLAGTRLHLSGRVCKRSRQPLFFGLDTEPLSITIAAFCACLSHTHVTLLSCDNSFGVFGQEAGLTVCLGGQRTGQVVWCCCCQDACVFRVLFPLRTWSGVLYGTSVVESRRGVEWCMVVSRRTWSGVLYGSTRRKVQSATRRTLLALPYVFVHVRSAVWCRKVASLLVFFHAPNSVSGHRCLPERKGGCWGAGVGCAAAPPGAPSLAAVRCNHVPVVSNTTVHPRPSPTSPMKPFVLCVGVTGCCRL